MGAWRGQDGGSVDGGAPELGVMEVERLDVDLPVEMDVTALAGTVARVGPGDVVLAEDLTGRGHVTRVVGSEPRFYAIVPLTEK